MPDPLAPGERRITFEGLPNDTRAQILAGLVSLGVAIQENRAVFRRRDDGATIIGWHDDGPSSRENYFKGLFGHPRNPRPGGGSGGDKKGAP